jgi:hypothetical protein
MDCFFAIKSRQPVPFGREPVLLIIPATSYSVDMLRGIVESAEDLVPLNSIWQWALEFFKSAERCSDGLYSSSSKTSWAFAN